MHPVWTLSTGSHIPKTWLGTSRLPSPSAWKPAAKGNSNQHSEPCFQVGPWQGERAPARPLKPFAYMGSWQTHLLGLVAQCSATPATVAATPPCSATPFQTQISVRHLPGMGGGKGATPKVLGGVVRHRPLHLQNAIKSRKSAATRVARHV